MAKHGKKFRKYLRGNADEFLALTTLAPTTVVSAIFDDVVFDRTYASSIRAAYSLSNFTPIADVGPIVIGVAHSDYSSAEIEEWIENTGAWNEGNMVSQEIAKRKIRLIGMFSEFGGATDIQILNDGKTIHTKLGWILLEGQSLQLWCYNRGSAAVATTVPDAHCQGYVNLWPQ